MLNKIIKYSFLIISILYFSDAIVSTAHASENFEVNNNVTYEINTTGNTTVTNIVSIINRKSEVYVKDYIFKLNNIKPDEIRVLENGNPIDFETIYGDKVVDIIVRFDNPLIGEGSKRNFQIVFNEPDLAERTGEVWEITIPKIDDPEVFDNYKIELVIPKELGNEAYISPEPMDYSDDDEFSNYHFSKEQLLKTGISAGFGKFQVFSFTLNYHLENNEGKEKIIEIAIPPDTSLQKVYYEEINPSPINVLSDDDGNWIATFNLNSNERLDVSVKGTVQIFSSPRKYIIPSPISLLANTKHTEFWQSGDKEIKSLAEKLKTPKNIYNYVVETLKYNSNKVNPDAKRMGAVNALGDPENALCMEFTDLFVAISRAAGIPAREINGYAYTENPQIQPISLVSDVLHAWPEYWDNEKSTWVSVDPTWTNTSGVDFFDKFDLRHFAFVIHGKDSIKPYAPGLYKLGNNPQKDVYVNFGQLPKNTFSEIEIKYFPSIGLNLLGEKYDILINNSGSTSIYNIHEKILVDGQVEEESFINILPPYAKFKDSVSIRYGLFGSSAPHSIQIMAGGNIKSINVNKNNIVIRQLIAISSVLILILFIIYRKTASVKSIIQKIRKG